MTSCLCGTPGFPNRRKLAAHIQERHSADEAPISAPRALLLADKIIDKARLRPEDYAVFGKEPPAVTPLPTREQRVAAEAREIAGRGLPTDADSIAPMNRSRRRSWCRRRRRLRPPPRG